MGIARPRVIRGTQVKPLPLLPSGPGGVCSRPLHEARGLSFYASKPTERTTLEDLGGPELRVLLVATWLASGSVWREKSTALLALTLHADEGARGNPAAHEEWLGRNAFQRQPPQFQTSSGSDGRHRSRQSG